MSDSVCQSINQRFLPINNWIVCACDGAMFTLFPETIHHNYAQRILFNLNLYFSMIETRAKWFPRECVAIRSANVLRCAQRSITEPNTNEKMTFYWSFSGWIAFFSLHISSSTHFVLVSCFVCVVLCQLADPQHTTRAHRQHLLRNKINKQKNKYELWRLWLSWESNANDLQAFDGRFCHRQQHFPLRFVSVLFSLCMKDSAFGVNARKNKHSAQNIYPFATDERRQSSPPPPQAKHVKRNHRRVLVRAGIGRAFEQLPVHFRSIFASQWRHKLAKFSKERQSKSFFFFHRRLALASAEAAVFCVWIALAKHFYFVFRLFSISSNRKWRANLKWYSIDFSLSFIRTHRWFDSAFCGWTWRKRNFSSRI